MNIKKAMLIFPQNVLVCWDLFIIDLLNTYKSRINTEHYNWCVDKLMETFNGDIVDTPLHKLVVKNGRLVIVDLMTELESSYTSLNKLIYGKRRFITIDVYEYLIKNGYRDLIKLGHINHKNINCDKLMEQYNNFIVYDSRNWDEKAILQGIYGGDDNQYIDRDKLMIWFDENINLAEDSGLQLTFVSDAFDIDIELGAECYHTLGMNKSRYIQTELRICCINTENMKRYNDLKDKGKDFYRSNVGLYKLWDRNTMGGFKV